MIKAMGLVGSKLVLDEGFLSKMLLDQELTVRHELVRALLGQINDHDPSSKEGLRKFFDSHPAQSRQMRADAVGADSQDVKDLLDELSGMREKISVAIQRGHFLKEDEQLLNSLHHDKAYILRMLFLDKHFIDSNWFDELMHHNEWANVVVQMALTTNLGLEIRTRAVLGISTYRRDLLLNEDTLSKLLSDPDKDIRRYTLEGVDVSLEAMDISMVNWGFDQDTTEYSKATEDRFKAFFAKHPDLLPKGAELQEQNGRFVDLLMIIKDDPHDIIPLIKSWPSTISDEKTMNADWKAEVHLERMIRHLLFLNTKGFSFQKFQVNFLDQLIIFLEPYSTSDPEIKDTLGLLKRSRAAGFTVPFMFDKETLGKILDEREKTVKDNYEKYFLVFMTAADRRGAFNFNAHIGELFKQGQRVLVFQVASKSDMVKAKEAMRQRGGKFIYFMPTAHSSPDVMDFGLNDIQRGLPRSYGNLHVDHEHELTVNDGKFLEGLLNGIADKHVIIAINGCSTAAENKVGNKSALNIVLLFQKALKDLNVKGDVYAPNLDYNEAEGFYLEYNFDEGGNFLGVQVKKSHESEIEKKSAKNNSNFISSTFASLFDPIIF